MQRPEIVIGLVYAAGTYMETVSAALSRVLSGFGYIEKEVRLSKLLEVTPLPPELSLAETPYEDYLTSRMKAGTHWRETLKRGDAMALLGISKIRAIRKEHHAGTADGQDIPIESAAFVIRSLKHPKEVEILREVYGPSFFLLSIYEAKSERTDHLARKIASSLYTTQFDRYRSRATEMIEIDDAEDGKASGQQVRKTFWQGDAFVQVSAANTLEEQMRRALEIWFGHPFHTPTRDEYLMFTAQAAAYRSASLGRQVGAVIATEDGSILAAGTNEVPKAGGGIYWSGDAYDRRDHVLGQDSSDVMRHDLLGDIMRRLNEKGWLTDDRNALPVAKMVEELLDGDKEEQDSGGRGIMEGAIFTNLTEFQRPVHAEMTALTDAARRGVPVQGATMYTTTFPCHGCARHIISAGIKRLVYIEPYVKSLAQNLHEDSISLGETCYLENRVLFEPFVGLAPRRYMDLFPMSKRKENDGAASKWIPEKALPRLSGWVHHLTILNEQRIGIQTNQALAEFGLISAPVEASSFGS